MILDEFVEIKWNWSNKEHFINIGYVFTKMRKPLIVKVCDLCKHSRVKIRVKCDICDTETTITYQKYNINTNNCNSFACSKKCGAVKAKRTNIKKYGFEHPQQNKEIKAKSIRTTLERYGYENVFQNEMIKQKSKETNMKKFRVEYPLQNIDIKNKCKKTNLKKYGVEYPLQNKKILSNLNKTNKERYGYENVFQNEIIKEKIKQTILKKYGVENISQLEKIKEQKRISCIKKYGVLYFKYVPKYNPNSIMYLDMLSDKLNLPIQHALNGGEKKFIRYYVDGYIEEYNICIEWDEKYHNNKKQKERDLIRESFIKEKFNCNIIRINEKEFLNNIEDQTNIIMNSIKKLMEAENIISNNNGL